MPRIADSRTGLPSTGSRRQLTPRRVVLVGLAVANLALLIASSASAQNQVVQSFALNGYKRVLDGQWQGIRYASDGNVYFASSTHSAHHGAAFFKYDPRTNQVTLLADDLTIVAGEDPLTNPQGKMHSDIVEANGWLYMSTHFSSEGPGAYSTWSGSHLIGYELATGTFRDYGVVHPNYTSYSGVGVDPARNYVYVYVTGQEASQVSYIYRIDAVTGAKTNLGEVGGSFRHSFWMFVDRRGDVWFSLANQSGALRRIRADSGQMDVYPNALPPLDRWDVQQPNPIAEEQTTRFIMWMQPLDGDRALFTLGWYGGMLYMFDSSKPIGSGQEFQVIKHIGYSDLGLAIGGNRLFYYQRANRGFGHQEAQDFHLMSMSLTSGSGYPITDHGLLIDQDGRLLWRAPGMMTDGHDRVFMIGDWWTIPGDLGTLRYSYANGRETYDQLPRGQFFAVANAGSAAASALSSLVLSPTIVYGDVTTTNNRVSLSAPAPAGGYAVTLSSSDASVAAVPASIVVPEGATTSAAFSITARAGATDKVVTITAKAASVTRTANLTVSVLGLSSLALSPGSVVGGNPGEANRVGLNAPAPVGGATVSLSSSHPSVAAVPATVIVPAGADVSPYFTITTSAVPGTTAVTITASYTSGSGAASVKTATLTVAGRASADGTTVPSAPEITDNAGAVWTIGANQRILRNGVQAAGGLGSKILWTGNTLYVLGTDSNWYQWLGTTWSNVGPVQPGNSSGPPPSGTSPSGTMVPPASQVVDSGGAVWTIGASQRILRNGAQAAGGLGSKLLWTSNTLYVLGTDNNWYRWTGTTWSNVGPTQPGSVSEPPPPPPSGTSPSGTMIPPAPQVVDGAGAVWIIDGNQRVLRNGSQAAGGIGSKLLWTNNTVYVLGTGNSWYEWLGAGWINVGPAQPGGGGGAPPSDTSPSGTMIPPASQVVDSGGAIWTIGANQRILRNGAHAAGGLGSKVLWTSNTLYVLGTDNSWYKWIGAGWTNVGPAQPQ